MTVVEDLAFSPSRLNPIVVSIYRRRSSVGGSQHCPIDSSSSDFRFVFPSFRPAPGPAQGMVLCIGLGMDRQGCVSRRMAMCRFANGSNRQDS